MKKIILAVLALLIATPVYAAAPSVLVTWVDNSNNEDAFYIYRKAEACAASSAIGSPIANVPANTTSWVDVSVSGGATYCYSILAANGVGLSPNTQAQVTVPGIPAAPSGATAVAQ